MDNGKTAKQRPERDPHPFRQPIQGMATCEGRFMGYPDGSTLFHRQVREVINEGIPVV